LQKEENARRERIGNENIRENLNTLEEKLISEGIKWHAHVLRVNEDKNLKEDSELETKRKMTKRNTRDRKCIINRAGTGRLYTLGKVKKFLPLPPPLNLEVQQSVQSQFLCTSVTAKLIVI
jgi:hypothetical protein